MFDVEETIRTDTLLEHAVRYVDERHWDVLPGTWIEFHRGAARCSCTVESCYAPGAHPTRMDWPVHATGSAAEARRLWTAEPRAAILLPTGRTFDAIDVPDTVGCLALARMERLGTPTGPVAGTPYGRMLFFALPGSGARVPEALRRLGWSAAAMDLTVRSEGDFVPAPPTRIGVRGPVQWARRPTRTNRWLPGAQELMAALAYACGQDRALARS